MRSFLFSAFGLFFAATSISAAPVVNLQRRSASSVDVGQAIFARDPPVVSYSSNVPEDQKDSLRDAVHAHHAALPDTDPAKNAAKAHVLNGGWHKNDDDPATHATVSYYKAGATNTKNHLGRHHIYQRRSLSDDEEDIFARDPPVVSFSGGVPEDQKDSLRTAVHAHHAALPDTDPAKNAAKAHVLNGGWHSNDDDPATHATVSYYKAGATNTKNHLGRHHIYQ